MYGLKDSLDGHVHRPERQGSKREISGTEHSLSLLMAVYGRKTIRFSCQKGLVKVSVGLFRFLFA